MTPADLTSCRPSDKPPPTRTPTTSIRSAVNHLHDACNTENKSLSSVSCDIPIPSQIINVFICLFFVSTVYSLLLLYTVVVFLRRMLAFYSNLCVVHFFVSINDDDDDSYIVTNTVMDKKILFAQY